MPRPSCVWAFGAFVLAACSIWAQSATPQPRNPGRLIHVVVALCDNQFQGIVPVPPKIGDGDDPRNNLYWGAAYGVKTFFQKAKDWSLLAATPNPKPLFGLISVLPPPSLSMSTSRILRPAAIPISACALSCSTVSAWAATLQSVLPFTTINISSPITTASGAGNGVSILPIVLSMMSSAERS